MSPRSAAPIKATRTSLRIVEALREAGGAGVTDLADRLDMPNSTVHDHLRTLEADDYVVKDGEEYDVGTKFLDLGGARRKRMRIFRIAESAVQDLAIETGEHANLMVEEHGRGVFLQTVKGEDAVELDTHSGRRVHLQTTALGKSIMAHMSRERVDEILDEHGLPEITEHTVTDRDALYDELETIRERGYATDDEERVENMRCVAAPIVGPDDDVYAVSVSGPKSKFRGERWEREIPDRVLQTANIVEVNLTYQ